MASEPTQSNKAAPGPSAPRAKPKEAKIEPDTANDCANGSVQRRGFCRCEAEAWVLLYVVSTGIDSSRVRSTRPLSAPLYGQGHGSECRAHVCHCHGWADACLFNRPVTKCFYRRKPADG